MSNVNKQTSVNVYELINNFVLRSSERLTTETLTKSSSRAPNVLNITQPTQNLQTLQPKTLKSQERHTPVYVALAKLINVYAHRRFSVIVKV